jgi:hypothetical protein
MDEQKAIWTDIFKRAKSGDGNSMYMLAKLYEHGIPGVAPNEKNHDFWLKKASEAGYIDAQLERVENWRKKRVAEGRCYSRANPGARRDLIKGIVKKASEKYNLSLDYNYDDTTLIEPIVSCDKADMSFTGFSFSRSAFFYSSHEYCFKFIKPVLYSNIEKPCQCLSGEKYRFYYCDEKPHDIYLGKYHEFIAAVINEIFSVLHDGESELTDTEFKMAQHIEEMEVGPSEKVIMDIYNGVGESKKEKKKDNLGVAGHIAMSLDKFFDENSVGPDFEWDNFATELGRQKIQGSSPFRPSIEESGYKDYVWVDGVGVRRIVGRSSDGQYITDNGTVLKKTIVGWSER